MNEWNLADAKNRFSELVNCVLADGPQLVRRRKDAVIVISEHQYKKLIGKKPGFKNYLASGASFEGLNLERDVSDTRTVEL